MFVLFIAALHGIPVFLARASGKRSAVRNTALVMSVIACITGAMVYTWVDLLAIWLGYAVAVTGLKGAAPTREAGATSPERPPPPPSAPVRPRSSARPSNGSLIVAVLAALVVAWIVVKPGSGPLPTAPAVGPSSPPAAPPPAASTPSQSAATVSSASAAGREKPQVASVAPRATPKTSSTSKEDPEPRIWREDQVTLDKGCGPFLDIGDQEGYRGCRKRVLAAVVAAGPPPVLAYLPSEIRDSMFRACESFQLSADVAGHRRCMREKVSDVRVTAGASQ